MRLAQVKELLGTLRFQLTLWNTAVVLAMVIATLGAVREGMRFTLRHEADNQLIEDALEIRLTAEQLYPDREAIYDELNRKAVTHTHRGLFVQLFDDSGEDFWSSANSPSVTVPLRQTPIRGGPVSAGESRLVHVALQSPHVPRWIVRVGTSFAPLDADVSRLTRLMLGVGAVILIVSPLGGYWLAGRATRPLAQIIDTTARLHPSSLEERLPIRGTADELDRLSVTINGFLDRIASYLDQNREFTANAAHELRSPLAAIQSSLEVTLNADRSIDEYKESLAEVLDEFSELRKLVNQLLLLAESDSGRLKISREVTDLRQLAHRSVEMFQGIAELRGIDLRITQEVPLFLPGDATRLRQVLNNLIDNALKFTDTGGRVTLELSRSADGNDAVVRVRDTGAGIPAGDLPHVFDRFYCGDKGRQRQRERRGSGLGLSICESIITAHGGRIAIESTLGAGTTVIVTLPACGSTAANLSPREYTTST